MYRGRIPDEVIASVLKHHDIADVVGKYVHLTKQGRNLIGLCPFHSEKSPSFTVSPEKQLYNCFGCGAGGTTIRFVMDMEGYTFPEAVRALAEEAQLPYEWEEATAEQSAEQGRRAAMVAGHELAAKIYHYVLMNTAEGHKALAYLRSRGFTDKLIDEFQIGYAPPTWDMLVRYLAKNEFDPALMEEAGLIAAKDGGGHVDRFRDRVMFPIHDQSGKPIAFSGRTLGEGGPKYLNSPETPLFNKSRTLFNLHRAKGEIRKLNRLVLLEGFVDVIRAWQAEAHHTVAAMGTALTELHAKQLRRLAEQVVLCYDGDSAGQNAAYKSIALLEKEGCEVYVAMLPDKLDPDEYIVQHGSEAFHRNIVQAAVPAATYRLIHLRRTMPAGGDEGRLKFIEAALKVVAELQTPTEREHYLKQLSEQYGYSMEALREQLHQARRQLQKMSSQRDNNSAPWNNVMQDESVKKSEVPLLPAYHNAERKLLSAMLNDRDIAMYVAEKLGSQFNVEAHAAIAAYIYAYYSKENEPNTSKFIALLEDDQLAATANALVFADSGQSVNAQVIDDYIKEIMKLPRQQAIKKKREEQNQAVRSGDMQRAVQLGMEIISLEKELKGN